MANEKLDQTVTIRMTAKRAAALIFLAKSADISIEQLIDLRLDPDLICEEMGVKLEFEEVTNVTPTLQ